MRAASVIGVRMELPSNQPIVLLREDEGSRYLPIWIGAVEAAAIANVQQGVITARPLTHDLIRDIMAAIGVELTRVEIVDLQDRIFFAELIFDDGTRVSARPSDAIAIALRVQAEILVAEAVLAEAGIELTEATDADDDDDSDDSDEADEDEEGTGQGSRRRRRAEGVVPELEVERFREFLDTISPEDFGGS